PEQLTKKVFKMVEETIMIIDDDENLCVTLSDIFLQRDINVITAYTGDEALEKAIKFSPSVVLIDLKLPDMEGTQLFQELKKVDPNIICIYISGYARLEHTLIAFKNEAEGFYIKPLPLDELISRIEELLEKKRLKEALKNSEEKYKKLSESLEIQVEERTRNLLETKEKLIRQERLGIFGQIAGGIAHEFNNILSTIIGATDILLGDVKNEDSIKLLNVILKQSLLASNFSKKMLDFSKFNAIEPKVVELEEFFTEIKQIFVISFSVNIIITLKLEFGKLLIDPFQLQQALMNLLINSIDALSENGRVTIIISSVTNLDVSDFELNEVRSGDYIRIQIEDNGKGMSKETQNNLFIPFYSTKPIGKGAGLGLSQVYGIIRQYSGYIDFESEEGRGTTFSLFFPKYVQG
ncbi:MAG: ATP-binding protein, partial [Candidatus Heimdallarchaeaceae archaeon]